MLWTWAAVLASAIKLFCEPGQILFIFTMPVTSKDTIYLPQRGLQER